jgi:hypothetical protein
MVTKNDGEVADSRSLCSYIHCRLPEARGLDGMSSSDLPLYGYERLTPEHKEVVITEREKSADALFI